MADYKGYYDFRQESPPEGRYVIKSDFDSLKKRVEALENQAAPEGFDDRNDLVNRIARLEAEKLALLEQIKRLKDAGDKMANILKGFQ